MSRPEDARSIYDARRPAEKKVTSTFSMPSPDSGFEDLLATVVVGFETTDPDGRRFDA